MTSNNRRSRALVLSLAAFAAVAAPAPLLAQAQSCEAGAPFQDPSVNASLLPAFNKELSGAWPTAAAQKIDPLTDIPPFQTTVSCDPVGITACAATIVYPECEHITVNMQLDQITGLSELSFSDMTAQNFNVKEVAQHTQSGPDAGKITDGVFAPEGEEWNHPSYTVVLTSGVSSTQFQNALLQSALTIDLGSPIQICTSSQCGGATVQADRHSFALEYSTDGTSWMSYGTVPYKDSDGLHTRSVTIASSFGGQPVTAQYVRVYGGDDKDGNNDYSISELELKDPQGNIISISKRAIGPRPYQIADGQPAPEGHTWNDPTYAAVLRSVGEAHALVIDLGALVTLCGNSSCGPTVQADRHPFQIDFSPDGNNWVPYSQVPEVSGSGLITRTPSQIAANAKVTSFTARYVRLYGLPADDDDYSISEVTLRNTASGNPVVSTGKLTYGPEALATDGEVAPEGADWNDPRYANILSPCGQPPNANTICTEGSQTGLTGALLIDLGDVLTLSALQVQADRHQFQIDYRGSETDAWQPLYTVPSVSDDGLTTRPIQHLLDPQPQARYLMMYGTAGDDDNYSVSSVQVDSDIAKTPCAYASGANAGQQYASCSYDGTMTTKITVPSGALATAFTIVSAEAQYHCTGPAGSTNIPVPDGEIIGGTTCTGNLQLPPGTLYSGGFCSATCGASTEPASVLTYASVSPEFTLTDLSCNHSTGNLTDAVQEVAAGTASTAVEEFFGGLAVSPLPTPTGQVLPPMIPSGTCRAPPAPPSNTHLRGLATHVGKASEAGQVSLSGTVSAPGAPPLHTLTLALQRVLHEPGGVEELVRTANTGVPAVPLTLLPKKGSDANRAVYATAPGVKPSFRAEVRNAPPGQLEFSLDVRGAHMPTAPTCTEGPSPSVMLGTDFSLGTIEVHALQDWQCEGKHRLTTP